MGSVHSSNPRQTNSRVITIKKTILKNMNLKHQDFIVHSVNKEFGAALKTNIVENAIRGGQRIARNSMLSRK